MQVITKDGLKPPGWTGRQWRAFRSRMRKMGSRPRGYWRDNWRHVRQHGPSAPWYADKSPEQVSAIVARGLASPTHPMNLTREAANRCFALRGEDSC